MLYLTRLKSPIFVSFFSPLSSSKSIAVAQATPIYFEIDIDKNKFVKISEIQNTLSIIPKH